MTKEDLLQISELMDAKLAANNRELEKMMDAKLAPINERLDKVEAHLVKVDEHLAVIDERLDKVEAHLVKVDERLDRLEENTEVTRDAVNALCEWADNVAVITQIRFPIKKAAGGAD